MEQLIEAKQLSLQIDSLKGQKQTILRNIHLTIKRGRICHHGTFRCGKPLCFISLAV